MNGCGYKTVVTLVSVKVMRDYYRRTLLYKVLKDDQR